MQLEDVGYNWKEEEKDLGNQMAKSEFFSLFEADDIKNLLLVKTERLLEKDEFIIKEDEKARYLFLITRGQASEETSKIGQSYVRKLRPGDLIGAYNVINKNLRYFTSVCSNSIMCVVGFPLQDIISLAKKKTELQGYLYKYCLPLITRMNKKIDQFGSFTSEEWAGMRKNLDHVRLQPG